ncbi:PH domain-containing protein [Sporolactobacillus sp. STSJ-5]|uniref:PH domain-containing protein n=1 Tax=Sporolactobacillus sp. STSJ-5 TaxID=2965076 RepID=UPI0021025934|nr:PH domain-containing protein [Sporolactobacillus sp. STSJ-5]MCQ2009861.1 PH domain-containing protein [Sporolactobacillus sp. STSJ-5]
MKSKGKHLHFFAIISDAVSTLWSIIVPLGFGFAWGMRHLGQITGYALIILLVIIVFNFFKWLRFKYEFVDDQFHIRSGVLVRSDRYIRIQRIQSVQIKTNLLLRLLGVVQLKFDTADQASKGDMVLSALKLEEAEKIKAEVSRGKTQKSIIFAVEDPTEAPKVVDDSPKKVYALSGKRLLGASLLTSKVGVVLAAVFGLWSQADDFIPDSIQGQSLSYLEHASLVGMIIIIGMVILMLWLVSLVSALLRWGFFKLSVHEGEWRIHRGVWETSDETYKTDRVQAIRIKEQWLQQLFGWCTVYADCSGSIDLEKSNGGSVLVFPLLRKKELPDFLETAIPRFSGPIKRHPLPMRGTLYRMILPAIFWIGLCSVLTWRLDWGKYSLIALPFILAYFWFKNRSEGWALMDKRLIAINRWLTKTTTITRKEHIQSFAKRQSRIQKKLHLSTCSATIRASTAEIITIHQLDETDADKLFQWFRKK